MNNKEAYHIIREIKSLLNDLEGELSSSGDYIPDRDDIYDHVLAYYQTNTTTDTMIDGFKKENN